ncbi:hypothetical protein SCHPADRAFT_887951 [Schizopora paradoxa]|uniref:Uncharacterized protein n=1 Tax=Schizopora paradoxa TaxID=27342 RepID=A0A0H2RVV8_9AGAM|nr:hypothetical protein SCHPADRAFT_887951 [Schizopora paradoxa]
MRIRELLANVLATTGSTAQGRRQTTSNTGYAPTITPQGQQGTIPYYPPQANTSYQQTYSHPHPENYTTQVLVAPSPTSTMQIDKFRGGGGGGHAAGGGAAKGGGAVKGGGAAKAQKGSSKNNGESGPVNAGGIHYPEYYTGQTQYSSHTGQYTALPSSSTQAQNCVGYIDGYYTNNNTEVNMCLQQISSASIVKAPGSGLFKVAKVYLGAKKRRRIQYITYP